MIEINPRRWVHKPYQHQIDGVKLMARKRSVALFDETGAGKTKQLIDAACELYDAGEIDTVVIVCPAQVKDVWVDVELGEIAKHSWVASTMYHYDARNAAFEFDEACDGRLAWVVTSLEFIRQEDAQGDFPRVEALVKKLTRKGRERRTLLAADESSGLNNHKSLQTRAANVLRRFCDRAVAMNGTPDNPLHLYSQYEFLDPSIIGCNNFYHFRAKYCVMGGFNKKAVVGYQNLDELTKKTAPYTLRRMKEDCLDLPAKMPPSFMTVPLSAKTWKLYRQMKDEMIAELDRGTLLVQHAPVKTLRLAQIVSGFLGGWYNEVTDEPEVEEISDEKTAAAMRWFESQLEEDEKFQVIIWCRFRPEIARLFDRLSTRFKNVPVEMLVGGQKKSARRSAIELLHPTSSYDGPAFLIGQPQAGRFGLNFTKCHRVFNLSRDYSLMNRKQSEDRVHRPGQTKTVTITDMLATGPDGQKTIDHHQFKLLSNQIEVSKLTTEGWKKALREEM